MLGKYRTLRNSHTVVSYTVSEKLKAGEGIGTFLNKGIGNFLYPLSFFCPLLILLILKGNQRAKVSTIILSQNINMK